MKTFGTATLSRNAPRWKLQLEPHVAIRAKRLFQGSKQDEAGVVHIPANDEACRDLAWFMERYPLEVNGRTPRGFKTSEVWLRARADAYDQDAREALAILDGDFESPALEMGVTPRHYQEQAAALAHHTGALLLADVVGLGKTISALTLLARADTRPALIVAQAHLAQPGGQWETEVARALPGVLCHTIKQSTPYELPTFLGRQPEVLVCSYHKLNGWRDYLAGRVRTVIWDEVQELRTGRKAKKNEASCHIAREAQWKLGLSATPIFNYGGEIFNVLAALKPGVLGTSSEFIREWCKDGPSSGKYLLKDTKAFHAWACRAGIYLRRTRKDVGRELAPLNHVVHEIESRTDALEAASGSAMQLAQRIMQAQSGLESMQASAQLSMELRQATGIDKAPYVAQFVRMLVEEQQEPVVVFGWHRACFAAGTRALMLDGTTKKVEDVEAGDRLMGPDSQPRVVQNLTRGRGRMYRIIPNKGEPWTCSAHHILTVWNGRRYEKWTAEEFAQASPRWQRDRLLYRADAVEFEGAQRVEEPWLMGFWLGDGAASLRGLRVASADPEVEDELRLIADRHGLGLSTWASPGATGTSKTKHIAFTSGFKGPKDRNRLLRHFRSLGLDGNKHIPASYQAAPAPQRRELLAGLLDSDGHVYRGNGAGSADYSSTSFDLANQVAFVARSLGLAAYVSLKRRTGGYGGGGGSCYCVTISGDLTQIPTRIARKRAPARAGQKSVLRTGFQIEPAGVMDFYGFEVDQDHLFLLDDFTVVHNCYDIWLEKLADLKPAMYTGSESGSKKRHEAQRFIDGDTDVLFLSLRSGQGLDGLQHRCSTAVIGELDWSPAVLHQCIGRVHRDGQTNPVFAYYLTSRFGADPTMTDVLGLKKAQLEGVLGVTEDERDEVRQVDPGHVKSLALAYMESRGLTYTAAREAEHSGSKNGRTRERAHGAADDGRQAQDAPQGPPGQLQPESRRAERRG